MLLSIINPEAAVAYPLIPPKNANKMGISSTWIAMEICTPRNKFSMARIRTREMCSVKKKIISSKISMIRMPSMAQFFCFSFLNMWISSTDIIYSNFKYAIKEAVVLKAPKNIPIL